MRPTKTCWINQDGLLHSNCNKRLDKIVHQQLKNILTLEPTETIQHQRYKELQMVMNHFLHMCQLQALFHRQHAWSNTWVDIRKVMNLFCPTKHLTQQDNNILQKASIFRILLDKKAIKFDRIFDSEQKREEIPMMIIPQTCQKHCLHYKKLPGR